MHVMVHHAKVFGFFLWRICLWGQAPLAGQPWQKRWSWKRNAFVVWNSVLMHVYCKSAARNLETPTSTRLFQVGFLLSMWIRFCITGVGVLDSHDNPWLMIALKSDSWFEASRLCQGHDMVRKVTGDDVVTSLRFTAPQVTMQLASTTEPFQMLLILRNWLFLFRASHFLQCSCCCGFGCVYSQAEYVPETEQVSFCLAWEVHSSGCHLITTRHNVYLSQAKFPSPHCAIALDWLEWSATLPFRLSTLRENLQPTLQRLLRLEKPSGQWLFFFCAAFSGLVYPLTSTRISAVAVQCSVALHSKFMSWIPSVSVEAAPCLSGPCLRFFGWLLAGWLWT